MKSTEEHWEAVWHDRPPDEMSWHEASPARSIELIRSVSGPDSSVIDVGGGASLLVDELLALGYEDLTVLDVSHEALGVARERLGADAARVEWIVADVLAHRFERVYDVWHDRAVFHFLVDPTDRVRYVNVLAAAIAPGGHAVVATFGPDGPATCSGLPVQRYDRTMLAETLGGHFELTDYLEDLHHTPAGARQQFAYGLFERFSAP
jgi:2-polyprenyl-3-methyl-5-hydroxy-6-metoxy-1,4-benzoquinol methylase